MRFSFGNNSYSISVFLLVEYRTINTSCWISKVLNYLWTKHYASRASFPQNNEITFRSLI